MNLDGFIKNFGRIQHLACLRHMFSYMETSLLIFIVDLLTNICNLEANIYHK